MIKRNSEYSSDQEDIESPIRYDLKKIMEEEKTEEERPEKIKK
jgi:hypothetical protein